LEGKTLRLCAWVSGESEIEAKERREEEEERVAMKIANVWE
jgi:hypothetical protein